MALQKTYPDLDFYQFGQMEHTSATANYVPLWKELDRKYGVGQILNLEEVFGHGDRYPVRKNFRENVTGEIEFLWLIDKIFLERGALGKIVPTLVGCWWVTALRLSNFSNTSENLAGSNPTGCLVGRWLSPCGRQARCARSSHQHKVMLDR